MAVIFNALLHLFRCFYQVILYLFVFQKIIRAIHLIIFIQIILLDEKHVRPWVITAFISFP